MPNDQPPKKSKNKFDDALDEFNGKDIQSKNDVDSEFDNDIIDDLLSDLNQIDGKKHTHSDHSSNVDSQEDYNIDDDLSDTSFEIDDNDITLDTKTEKKQQEPSNTNRFNFIVNKFKEPKNAVILIFAICFLLFLILKNSGSKKDVITYKDTNNTQEEIIQDIKIDTPKEENTPKVQEVNNNKVRDINLDNIQLPDLNIELPVTKKSEVSLLPQIPEPKIPEPVIPEPKVPEPTTQEPKIPEPPEINLDGETKDTASESDIDVPKIKKIRPPIGDKTQLPPLIKDFSGGNATTTPTKDKKNTNDDFIFINTDLDVEMNNDAISANRIKNPENVIAQGRIIDAVLETAINSTIEGQVRAIITRDVYAEVGRNILIPKGTRLYGQYGGDKAASTESRIIIIWTRIVRPDNVSATINSFASDQFGRSGINGNVDKKYFSSITSSVLLSAIPLVSTILTNAITNQNPQTVTTGAAGNTTIIQDPINIATQSFTNQVTKIASDMIGNIANNKPIITLDQGTRVKVLVNQDLKLPGYQPITSSSSSISRK